MMQVPTEFEIQHLASEYDPAKAHEYYEKHKKLKGRRRGRGDKPIERRIAVRPPRAVSLTFNPLGNKTAGNKAEQRKQLQAQIKSLEDKLQKLEAKIREREHKEASEDRKGKAKKERAAKEKDKPKTAAEKAEAARESEKYRKKHKQELKSKAKDSGKSGGGSDKKSGEKKDSLSSLKALATKIKGQIAVAKQKLAAL